MSWYEEATKAIVALINAAIEERGDMPEPKEITDIIAKHDPNRWIPVEERMPPLDNFNRLTSKSRLVIQTGRMFPVFAYWNPGYGHWQGPPYSTDIVPDVTHWREIVLPEVKE